MRNLALLTLTLTWLAQAMDQPNLAEISLARAAGNGDTTKAISLLTSHPEIRGNALGQTLNSAAFHGFDQIVQEILKIRASDIDAEQANKTLQTIIKRHNEKSFIRKPNSEKEKLSASDVTVVKSILDAKGSEIDGPDLRDAYDQAMKIQDSSRRPIVEALVAVMKKRGIEWN